MIVSPFKIPVPTQVPQLAHPSSATGDTFADALGGAISAVEESSAGVRNAASDLLTGGRGDVHTVALIAQRAELTLDLFLQVRNKFVAAYQEVMKMPM